MNLFCFALFAFTSLTAQAASRSAAVEVSAQRPSQSIQLSDQRFEPIYESQPYQSTCSREVFDHNNNVCRTVSDSVCSGGGERCETTNDSVCNSSGCTNVPRRVCHSEPRSCTDVPRRVCEDYPVYRTEYFSCIQYHDVVVGQRLVKTFNHQIEIVLANPTVLGGAAINLQVLASEASLTARMAGSFSGGLLNYQVATLSEADSGSELNRIERITIGLALPVSVLQTMQSATIESLEMGRDAFRFKLKNAASIAEHLNVSIRLVRNRSLFANATRYDGTQTATQLGLVGQGSDIQALIPYQKLNADSLGNNRHDLSISVSLNPGSAALLNASDFQAQLDRRLQLSISKEKPSF